MKESCIYSSNKPPIAILVKNLTSGGAEKQSVLLALSLSEYCEVHYIIFNANKIHEKYLVMLKGETNINVHLLYGSFLRRLKSLECCLLENKINSIFSYLTMANVLACYIGKKTKVKNIYTGLRNAFLPLAKLFVDRWLVNYCATKGISNSFSGKQNFLEKGFDEKKIIVIPNCFTPILPFKEKHPQKYTTIITVGRFVPQKDYETAIRAVAQLANKHKIRYIIVGYGELELQIRHWVNMYGIDNISTIYINPDNIAQLEDEADIYFSTSLYEGTSNSIMEGMNANLPIVCTNVGDNNQLVEDGKNGFICDVKDVESLTMALSILCNDCALRNAFGKVSKEKLEANYSVDYFRQQYLKLIH